MVVRQVREGWRENLGRTYGGVVISGGGGNKVRLEKNDLGANAWRHHDLPGKSDYDGIPVEIMARLNAIKTNSESDHRLVAQMLTAELMGINKYSGFSPERLTKEAKAWKQMELFLSRLRESAQKVHLENVKNHCLTNKNRFPTQVVDQLIYEYAILLYKAKVGLKEHPLGEFPQQRYEALRDSLLDEEKQKTLKNCLAEAGQQIYSVESLQESTSGGVDNVLERPSFVETEEEDPFSAHPWLAGVVSTTLQQTMRRVLARRALQGVEKELAFLGAVVPVLKTLPGITSEQITACSSPALHPKIRMRAIGKLLLELGKEIKVEGGDCKIIDLPISSRGEEGSTPPDAQSVPA